MTQKSRAAPWVGAVAVLCLSVWLGQGCSGQASVTRVACGACEDPDQFVRLQTDPASHSSHGHGRFSHPFTLSPEDWKSILSSVRVQTTKSVFLFFSKKEPDMPAFRKDQVEFLSSTLSKAFAEAQPDERVVFGLTERESPDIMKMTTGGWFVEGADLHLVVANYQFAVTMSSIRDLLTKNPLRPNTGRTFELAAGQHQTLVQDSRAGRSVLDPNPVELSIAYKPLLLAVAESATAVQETKISKPSSAKPQEFAPSSLKLEERLDRLKRLRESGLITEEEYREKRKQLLEQL